MAISKQCELSLGLSPLSIFAYQDIADVVAPFLSTQEMACVRRTMKNNSAFYKPALEARADERVLELWGTIKSLWGTLERIPLSIYSEHHRCYTACNLQALLWGSDYQREIRITQWQHFNRVTLSLRDFMSSHSDDLRAVLLGSPDTKHDDKSGQDTLNATQQLSILIPQLIKATDSYTLALSKYTELDKNSEVEEKEEQVSSLAERLSLNHTAICEVYIQQHSSCIRPVP